MLKYVEQMTDAILIRHSNRHFTDEHLSIDHSKAVQEFITSLNPPFEHHATISYHVVPKDDSVVYFKNPRQFVALESENATEEQAKLGFLGELIVLFCESLGIQTCWMGHYKKRQVYDIVYKNSKQNKNRKLYCIIVLGYIPDKTSLLDRFSKRRFSKKHRQVEFFLHKNSLRTFSSKIQFSLELASKAPSAMNTQKWYYLISKNDSRTSIEIGKIKGYQHFKWPYYDIDVGTAAAHCWLGLQYQNCFPYVECSSDNSSSVWKFTLESNI